MPLVLLWFYHVTSRVWSLSSLPMMFAVPPLCPPVHSLSSFLLLLAENPVALTHGKQWVPSDPSRRDWAADVGSVVGRDDVCTIGTSSLFCMHRPVLTSLLVDLFY